MISRRRGLVFWTDRTQVCLGGLVKALHVVFLCRWKVLVMVTAVGGDLPVVVVVVVAIAVAVEVK